MSRGPGRWQRAVLEVLDQQDAATATAIARAYGDGSASDMSAVRRAIKSLAGDGRVRAVSALVPNATGREDFQLVVTRLDSSLTSQGRGLRPDPDWHDNKGIQPVMTTRAISQTTGVSASTVARDLRSATTRSS